MFKKGILVLLVIFLFVASVSALDPIVGNLVVSKDLVIDFELRSLDGISSPTESSSLWLDIYVTSIAQATLSDTTLVLSSTWLGFLPLGDQTKSMISGVSGILGSIDFSKTTSAYGVLSFTGSVNIMPKSRIYLGSIKAYPKVGGGISVSMSCITSPCAGLDSSVRSKAFITPGVEYALKLGTIKTITSSSCISFPEVNCAGNCGKMDDGCGGIIDCSLISGGITCTAQQYCNAQNACVDLAAPNVCPDTTCPSGQVWANGACLSAVSQVLPANAPQYDKDALQQMSSALNSQLSKLQKLSAIVNAVKAWLAAQ